MSTIALREATKWHDDLMHFFRVRGLLQQGRRYKESAVRSDLSKESGVPESYLYRIAHKQGEIRSLDAEMYRLLGLAHAKYVSACERIEEAADAMRAERMKLKEQKEDEDAQSHLGMAKGVVAAEAAVDLNGERPRGLGASRQ